MLFAGGETYASLAAVNGGTDESLVTTGEKYIWNNLVTAAEKTSWNNKVDRSGDVMTGNLTLHKLSGTDNITYGTTLPSSPTNGQIFLQLSDPYYELPPGGTTGQVLTKSSNADRAVVWANAQAAGNYVNKTGDTMSGNLTVSKTNTASITATNTTTSCSISLNTESTGAHGIYSAGYYNGSSFTNDPKWIVYRNGTNGAVLLNGTATSATSATTDASGHTFTSYYGHALSIDSVNNTISLVDANGNALGNSVSLPQSGVTALAAGTGLITNLTNNGTITGVGTIKANLDSETSLGTLGSTNKLYAVGVDANGKLCVNVPWVGSVIQDNLTSSTNTTDALSAKQGYLLANGSARDSTKLPLAGGTMTGNIEVSSTSNIDLGSSSYPWDNVYANTFNGAMSHYIDIGGKQYNGSADITIYASDLGVSSALNFAGIISETLPNMHDTGYPSTNDVHLYSNGNLVTKSSGTVVICHDTQDEFLWSEDASGNAAWYSLGLASSFALHNHTHGNILNNGAIAGTISINNVSTSSASKAIVTDSSSNITIEDLTVSDPSVLNNANATSFISSISQSSTGKITAVKSNISDVYVYNTGDTMTDSLTISKAGECGVIVNNTSKSHQVEFIVGGSGNGGVYDRTNSKYIVYSDVSGNVTLNGNASSATKATQDGSGNVITSTYVKKAGDTMTGVLTLAAGSGSIKQKMRDTSNYESPIVFENETPSSFTYKPHIGFHNTGGNSSYPGMMELCPWGTNSSPWTRANTGLSITYDNIQFKGQTVRIGTVAIADGGTGATTAANARTNLDVVCKSGDTMTGNLKVVAAGDHYVEAQNTDTSCRILLDSGSTTTKKHGLWSSGYYNTSYTASSCWILYRSSDSYVHTDTRLYGAVWNDYAEYRITKEDIEPGRCIIETGDDDLVLSTKRMQPGAEIVSDTFGFALGQTDEAKTPIASNGRVLAYPFESIEEFRKNIGRPVCSGPNGTVSIMTDEEYQKYGYCAIGTISTIPSYEEWGEDKVKVNGRVWIRVR